MAPLLRWPAAEVAMVLKVAQFFALLFVALALVPAGAHLAALPGKIGLAKEPYFTVQAIYQGWALFGVAQAGAIVATAALAWFSRHETMPFMAALVACGVVVVTLVLFFGFVFPANQATQNWTVIPENWEALRAQWEYGHAVNAGLTLFAFIAAALAVVNGPPGG
jgi:hypothetical protein